MQIEGLTALERRHFHPKSGLKFLLLKKLFLLVTKPALKETQNGNLRLNTGVISQFSHWHEYLLAS